MSGLYLEGADWSTEKSCLIRSKPKVLVVELPILKVIPIESHRLKLQVRNKSHFQIIIFFYLSEVYWEFNYWNTVICASSHAINNSFYKVYFKFKHHAGKNRHLFY